ncbi:PhzF family phenazine biosynthesis protein [Teredinibacter purpureus]|uniref:PhzF family phenazine biosynthesis protein n=1 Tax=Teredinibacter purpureus TaxID=2731756 RepID=UPI0005F84D58|nr:PhzF family phenazine biosynthesis protein [Teredinibacter purpureus]
MELTFYQADAFTNKSFSGNPAAVMVLDEWLSDSQMLAIANEMNLSETAFLVPNSKDTFDFDIRWFTPLSEIDLCGHATVASAHVLFRHMNFSGDIIHFSSLSGHLSCALRPDKKLELDFPIRPLSDDTVSQALVDALGATPTRVQTNATRIQAVFDTSEQIAALNPDMALLKKLPQYGVCCTAIGDGEHDDVDFVCRFFAPAKGINEDPATGSAYTSLVPYFAQSHNKTAFTARQLSQRGGEISLELCGDRVKIAGDAVTVIKGQFYL